MNEQVFYKGKLYKKIDVKTMRILCAVGFLGVIGLPVSGLHRFYKKDYGLGILYILTGGIMGIGTLIDLIMMDSIVAKHNAIVDEVIKLKEVEEAKRQGKIDLYRNIAKDTKTHIRGEIDL